MLGTVRARCGAPVRAPTRQAVRQLPAAAKATPPRKGVAASGNRCFPPRPSGLRAAAATAAAAAAQPAGANDPRVVSTDFLVRFIAAPHGAVSLGHRVGRLVASLCAHVLRAGAGQRHRRPHIRSRHGGARQRRGREQGRAAGEQHAIRAGALAWLATRTRGRRERAARVTGRQMCLLRFAPPPGAPQRGAEGTFNAPCPHRAASAASWTRTTAWKATSRTPWLRAPSCASCLPWRCVRAAWPPRTPRSPPDGPITAPL